MGLAVMHTQPITIDYCPRCERSHKTIVARPLALPIGEFPAWAICPVTLEPVLVREEGVEMEFM